MGPGVCLMKEAIKMGYGTQVKTFCGDDCADAMIGSWSKVVSLR